MVLWFLNLRIFFASPLTSMLDALLGSNANPIQHFVPSEFIFCTPGSSKANRSTLWCSCLLLRLIDEKDTKSQRVHFSPQGFNFNDYKKSIFAIFCYHFPSQGTCSEVYKVLCDIIYIFYTIINPIYKSIVK